MRQRRPLFLARILKSSKPPSRATPVSAPSSTTRLLNISTDFRSRILSPRASTTGRRSPAQDARARLSQDWLRLSDSPGTFGPFRGAVRFFTPSSLTIRPGETSNNFFFGTAGLESVVTLLLVDAKGSFSSISFDATQAAPAVPEASTYDLWFCRHRRAGLSPAPERLRGDLNGSKNSLMPGPPVGGHLLFANAMNELGASAHRSNSNAVPGGHGARSPFRAMDSRVPRTSRN